MKWIPILHNIAFIAGILGVLSLVAAWIAGFNGSFFGLSEAHFFEDAKTLLLVSITFGIGTLIHQNEERRK